MLDETFWRNRLPTSRLLSDCQATAAAGYALVLALVTGFLLVGALILGARVTQTFAESSSRLVAMGGDQADSRPRGAGQTKRTADQPAAPAQSSYGLLWFLIAGGMVVLGIGGLTLRAFLKESKAAQTRKRQGAGADKILWSRLNAKRELLWKQLLTDQDLVLKNRIEVRHVMSADPVTIRKSTPGKRIGELFAKHRVRHLVVCDDSNRVLGLVRASDQRANPECCAQEIMTRPPAAVSLNAALGAAIALLFEQDDALLVVVDGERFCGVLTPTDLALTLHCSLQLWFRVAQAMQSNETNQAELMSTSDSMQGIAHQLECRARRLPDEVKVALRTGSSAALEAELTETMSSVSELMQQLEEARTQIQKQYSEISGLRGQAPDEATGAARREEFDRVLVELLPASLEDGKSLSLILYVAAGSNELPEEERQKAAEEHLRLTVERIAEDLGSNGYIARYSEDALAIVLPGNSIDDARHLGSRLADGCFNRQAALVRPRMSIVSGRRGESAAALLKRAETALVAPSSVRQKDARPEDSRYAMR